MADKVSEQVAQVIQDIKDITSTEITAFQLGIICGTLEAIYKTAKEQETAYANMCALYFVHKPKVLADTLETITDIIAGE